MAAAADPLKVFTSRENIAMSHEALREVLAEGRVILRPEVANARFEGPLVLSHEEFIEQKQIDIKLVAGRNLNRRNFASFAGFRAIYFATFSAGAPLDVV
jgi:hypothetical protein